MSSGHDVSEGGGRLGVRECGSAGVCACVSLGLSESGGARGLGVSRHSHTATHPHTSVFRMAAAVAVWSLAWALPAAATTLDDCIRTALKENPDAQSAGQRVLSAQAARRQAQSAFLPRVNLAGSYTRTDNAGQALFMQLNRRQLNFQGDLNNPDDTHDWRGSVTAQYRLFDGGRRRLDAAMAGEGIAVARAALEGVQNQLVHEITRSFYGVLQARAFASVQEESVKSIEESLRIAKERFQAGSTVKTDVLNLEVQLAQAREDLIRANHSAELALAALNAGIGRDMVAPTNVAETVRGELVSPPANDDLSVLDTKRPEMRAARIMADIQRDKWRRARRDLMPVVNAFGSYDQDKGDSDWKDSYFAGVSAELNIFDGRQTRSVVAQALADYRAAEGARQKARNDLKLDLIQAQLGVRDAWERLQVTQRSLENAREALRITQEVYKQGAAEISTLMTAQVGLTATRTRDVAAHYDYLTASSNLARARGELVEKYAAYAAQQ